MSCEWKSRLEQKPVCWLNRTKTAPCPTATLSDISHLPFGELLEKVEALAIGAMIQNRFVSPDEGHVPVLSLSCV